MPFLHVTGLAVLPPLAELSINAAVFQDAFAGVEDDRDEDVEIESMMAAYKKRGGKIISKHPYFIRSMFAMFKFELCSWSTSNVMCTIAGKDARKTAAFDHNGEAVEGEEKSKEEETASDAGIDEDSEGEAAAVSETDDSDSDDSDSDDSDFDFHAMAEQRRVDEKQRAREGASRVGFEVVPAGEPGSAPHYCFRRRCEWSFHHCFVLVLAHPLQRGSGGGGEHGSAYSPSRTFRCSVVVIHLLSIFSYDVRITLV